jgi:outer membrane immunogenic protein
VIALSQLNSHRRGAGRFAVAIIAALTAAPAAFAADMPAQAPVYTKAPVVAPAYSWSGFYAGVNAGGAWGNSGLNTSTTFDPADGYFALSSVPVVNSVGAQKAKPNGFTGGVEAGYNWQAGSFVVGIESDFSYLGLRGHATGGAVYPCCAPAAFTINSSVNTNWLFTARPRIGVASGNWLFYATGGLAITDLNAEFTFADNFNAFEAASFSRTKLGYAVGGGIEAGLWSNWTVKAEYLHVNFGTSSIKLIAPLPDGNQQLFTHSADLQANVARVGLNYRLGQLVRRSRVAARDHPQSRCGTPICRVDDLPGLVRGACASGRQKNTGERQFSSPGIYPLVAGFEQERLPWPTAEAAPSLVMTSI